MRLELLLLPLMLLTSCTDGRTIGGEECGSNASCLAPIFNVDEPIVGLWDRSQITNSAEDVMYTFISRYGQFLTYDYQQDDSGTGENCYKLDVGSINTAESTNVFRVYQYNQESQGYTEERVTMIRNGDDLKVNWENGDIHTWSILLGIEQADFTRCDS